MLLVQRKRRRKRRRIAVAHSEFCMRACSRQSIIASEASFLVSSMARIFAIYNYIYNISGCTLFRKCF